MVKITKHISFYFLSHRLPYINNIIQETNKYEYTTDIYIHTNSIDLHMGMLPTYTNGSITIVYHSLSGTNPFYLTWRCREYLKRQRDDYDIFMYIEDDILVPYTAVKYWSEYNEKLIALNYNLGFVRIEVENDTEYITDLFGEKFDTFINIDNEQYCVNNKNPYCAFWIYNKNEFNKFVESKYYDINNITGYGIREQSAVGLHGLETDWYKNTLIPMVGNTLTPRCKIYHMPNNYVTDPNTTLATIKFNDAVKVN